MRPLRELLLAREADGAAGVEHAAVLRHRERVDLTHVRVEVRGRVVHRLGRDRGIRRRQARLRVVRVDRGLAAAADHAGRPLDGGRQMLVQRGVVRGDGLAHAGVEGPALLDVAAPGQRALALRLDRVRAAREARHGVIGHGLAQDRRRVLADPRVDRDRVEADARDRVDVAGGVGGPLVVVVGAALDERGQVARGRVDAVEELDVLRADRARGRRAGRAREAEQRVEERVALLELGRLADADEAAAAVDVVDEVAFLDVAERVTRRVDEHDGAIARQVGRGDVGRGGSHGDRVVAGHAGGLERAGGGGGGGVGRAGRTREHEHLARIGGRRSRAERACDGERRE